MGFVKTGIEKIREYGGEIAYYGPAVIVGVPLLSFLGGAVLGVAPEGSGPAELASNVPVASMGYYATHNFFESDVCGTIGIDATGQDGNPEPGTMLQTIDRNIMTGVFRWDPEGDDCDGYYDPTEHPNPPDDQTSIREAQRGMVDDAPEAILHAADTMWDTSWRWGEVAVEAAWDGGGWVVDQVQDLF